MLFGVSGLLLYILMCAGAELRAVYCFISSFPFVLAFDVGGLGFKFCVFVAGWRHALRSEWPFIIIIKLLN